MYRVMFVCKKNSRRSQMAEGFANALGGDQVRVVSAGLASSFVDPLTVQVMQEVGIDISQQKSKSLGDFQPEDFDAVISLCGCGVNLPPEWLMREYFADWQLDDPEGGELDTFRRIRDQVKERVVRLLEEQGLS
ncbi:protein tyrosine phosphatase [Gloeomargarita lithophora Alchichica-D10]|uniref:Protein tyrosine phosphatase n=1 Tax=Gloeomargarita lithophora Alchichica-D10 TaxID=1188229 RepID=A0A1J0ABI0_9CYAN|nr:arsenate reductase, glutathione/glutaredoxin type [Gloeomargarita lithophora]APB33291.1 protein tyrosine phosphatase [Gloeomargarita lithophora Alchichica-D10]